MNGNILRIGFITCLLLHANSAIAEIPKLREGLWETVVENAGNQQPSMMCVDDATSDELFKSSQKMMGDKCTGMDMKKVGAKWTMDVHCNMGPMKMDISQVIEGDFESSFTSTTKMEMTPPLPGQGNNTSVSRSSYKGPCPPDMRPGDSIINGKKINTKEMLDKMPKDAIADMHKDMENIDPKALEQMMKEMQKYQQQQQTR